MTYRDRVRFRRFARRRWRLLGLVTVAAAMTGPGVALGHEPRESDQSHRSAADLSVTLAATPNPVQVGETATFTLTVANAGPRSAHRVRASIVLTSPRRIARAGGAGWSCEIDHETAECRRKRLGTDTTAPITFSVLAPPGHGRIGAGAYVASRTDDPDPTNNGAGLQIDVNNPPLVNADSASTLAGVAVDIPVLGNDTDPDGDQLTFVGAPTAAHGSVTCADLVCVYTPQAGFTGSDAFSYTVDDGRGASASAGVTMTVNQPPPSPPNPPGPLPGPNPGPGPDPNPDPNPDGGPGNSGPGVSVSGPRNVTEGQTARYTVAVVNTCTVVARQVLLRLTLPTGTKVVSAPSRSVLKGRTLLVPIGSLRIGKTRNVGVRLKFRPNGGTLRTIVAAVTASNGRLAGDGIVIAVRRG